MLIDCGIANCLSGLIFECVFVFVKLSEQEKLLSTLQEHISELHSATHRLQEEEVNSQIQLQLCRKQLEIKDTQAQKHTQEV